MKYDLKLIARLAMVLGMAAATACTPPVETEKDAGPTTTADAGPDDAGPNTETGIAEGRLCLVGATAADEQCRDGLICMPSNTDPARGTCTQTCSDGAGGLDESLCGDGTVCQIVISSNDPALDGDSQNTRAVPVCLETQTERSGQCYGFGGFEVNANSCEAPLECVAARTERHPAGSTEPGWASWDLRCKENCDPTTANACTAGECIPTANADSEWELQDPDQPLSLENVKRCKDTMGNDVAMCSDGFDCIEITDGSSACNKRLGWCGQAVPPAYELEQATIQQFACNEVNGDSYCTDNGAFDGVDNPGATQCALVLGDPNIGACIAICGFPEFDFNDNGQIDDNEREQNFDCADGWTCSDQVGLGFGQDGNAPVLTCVPNEHVVTPDAGNMDMDAGMAADAGTMDMDAGMAADAGSMDMDAGMAADAGMMP